MTSGTEVDLDRRQTFTNHVTQSETVTKHTWYWRLEEPLPLTDAMYLEILPASTRGHIDACLLPPAGVHVVAVEFVSESTLHTGYSAFTRTSAYWIAHTDWEGIQLTVEYPLCNWFRRLVGWIPNRPPGCNYKDGPGA